jgi:hypothetical protein
MKKSFLEIFGAIALVVFGSLLIWEVMAQPIPSMRLRDLQDVRHLVPPANGDALVWNTAAGKWTNGAGSGGGGGASLTNFNTTQFSTNGGIVSIKSGATVSNEVLVGTSTVNSNLNVVHELNVHTFLASNNVTFANNPVASGFWADSGAGAGLGGWRLLLETDIPAALTRGTGTPNTLAKFVTTNSIGDSFMVENPTNNNYTFGSGSQALNDTERGIAFGVNSTISDADDAIAIGSESLVTTNANNGIAIGNLSKSGDDNNADNAVALGTSANALSESSVAIGSGAMVGTNAENSIAVNSTISNNENNSVAILSAIVSGAQAVGIGNLSAIGLDADGAIAVGINSIVGTNAQNSVAVGAFSSVADNATSAVALGESATALLPNEFVLGNSSHKVSIPGVLRLSNTNQYTDNGTTLTRNGVPVGGGTSETNVQNNFYVTNLFVQNGAHNTMIITNSLTLQPIKTNLLATTSTGLVTNANYGTGIAWDPTTRTISATASGDTTATNIVTVTQTGTNASQLDFSLVARGGLFKITATNNLYFGVPANVNNTDFKHCWLAVQQPSTGTCLVTFTNGVFAQPQGSVLINDTNASAVVYYEMVSSPFTNGVVEVWMSQRSARP